MSNQNALEISVIIPVVAFDTGGNKEIVADGVTGSIVPYLDIDALIETSKTLLSDEDLRHQYAKNCKAHIAVIANEEHILNQYHNIFNAVMNETN